MSSGQHQQEQTTSPSLPSLYYESETSSSPQQTNRTPPVAAPQTQPTASSGGPAAAQKAPASASPPPTHTPLTVPSYSPLPHHHHHHDADDAIITPKDRVAGVYSGLFLRLIIPVLITLGVVCWCVENLSDGPRSSSLPYNEEAVIAATGKAPSTLEKLEMSFLNALFLILFIGFITFVMVFLYKKRCMCLLTVWLCVSAFSIFTSMTWMVVDLVCTRYQFGYDYYSIAFVLWNFGVVGWLSLFYYGPPRWCQMYLIYVSVVTAWTMTRNLPEWSTWFILVGMACYDLAAVLHPSGPLNMLIAAAQEQGDNIPGFIYNSDASVKLYAKREEGKEGEDVSKKAKKGGKTAAPLPPEPSIPVFSTSHPYVMIEDDEEEGEDEGNIIDNIGNTRHAQPLLSGKFDEPTETVTSYNHNNVNDNDVYSQGLRKRVEQQQEVTTAAVASQQNGGTVAVAGAATTVMTQKKEEMKAAYFGAMQAEGEYKAEGEEYTSNSSRSSSTSMTTKKPAAAAGDDDDDDDDEDSPFHESHTAHPYQLGLGDFIFYSILVARAALYSPVSSFIGAICVLAGMVGTLCLLVFAPKGKFPGLPALPISIFVGVFAYFFTRITSVNYVYFCAGTGMSW